MAATSEARSSRVRVLIDTGALLALSRPRDQYHERAVRLAERHLTSGGRFVGTTLILSELYSHLLYLRGARGARVALARLLDDPLHEWLEVPSEPLDRRSSRSGGYSDSGSGS
jgi:predicted nucleic acid-binding protein